MSRCHSCLTDSKSFYCKKCQKELFDGIPVDKLDFTPDDMSPAEETSYREGLSISGVQRKFSFAFDDRKKLVQVEKKGRYILKPIPNEKYTLIEDMPANEHLSMQIAKQVFKLNIAVNGLILMENDELAYITKRFDYNKQGEKIDQEDFAALTNSTEETRGKKFKYEYSLQECASHVIDKYTTAPLIVKTDFFKKVLFDYLICNGDSHLKNFSLYHPDIKASDKYVMTPYYDILNSRMHLGSKEDGDIALELFADGESTHVFDAVGFHTNFDFETLGDVIGLNKKVVEKTFTAFEKSMPKIEQMIERSFLSDDGKESYFKLLKDRMDRRILYRPDFLDNI